MEDSVTVILQITGTAEASIDYVSIPLSITIPVEGSVTFPIVPIDDTLTEGTEDIQISLAADPQYQIGTSSVLTIQIADDESKTYGTLIKIGNSGTTSFTYSWKTSEPDGCVGAYSNWGDWSAWSNCINHEETRNRTCDGAENATQQRMVWCERSDGVSMGDVSDVYAGCETGNRPENQIPCSVGCDDTILGDTETQNCLSYAWNSGGWSECTGSYSTWSDWSGWSDCSADCGGGTQTRTKTCNNEENGTRTQSVWCESNDGNGNIGTVADSFCDAGSKPATEESCSRGCEGSGTESQSCNTRDCVTYTWQAGNWGTCGGTYSTWNTNNWSNWSACSVNCGNGTQTRTTTCNNEPNGTQTRDIWCQGTTWDGNSSVVDNAYCSGISPTSTRSCILGCSPGGGTQSRACSITCYTYAWQTGAWSTSCGGDYSDWNSWSSWSTCTKNCGGGTHTRTRTCKNNPKGEYTRTVTCMRTSNFGEVVQVNDSYCTEPKPEDDMDCARGCYGSSSETEACNTQSCASCTTKGPGWWVIAANGIPYGCSSGITTSPFNDCNQFQPTTTTHCFEVCRNMKIEACTYIGGRCRNYKNNYGYDAYHSGSDYQNRYLQKCTFQTP